MKTGMIAALLALLATLAGCASPPPERPSGHLYAATELSAVKLVHGQQVAVLLGRDAASTLDYLQRQHDLAGMAADTPVATLAGHQAYDWLAQSLAQQFAEVTFYDDLDTLLADRPDVIVLLDAGSGAPGQARVVARFFDQQLTYIGRAQGQGREPAEALRQFDAELAGLLRPAA